MVPIKSVAIFFSAGFEAGEFFPYGQLSLLLLNAWVVFLLNPLDIFCKSVQIIRMILAGINSYYSSVQKFSIILWNSYFFYFEAINTSQKPIKSRDGKFWLKRINCSFFVAEY